MAQLNSLIVTGDSRFLNTINGNITSTNAIHRATMETSSTATAFVLTADGIDSLYDGLIITCKNIKVASASGCTINLNGLGAKSIWLSQNNSACTTHWGLNHTYFFIYDGANSRWELQQGRDTNDNDTSTLRSYYSRPTVDTNGIKQYSLFAYTSSLKVSSFTTNNGTGTKTFNTTNYFDIRKIFYYNGSDNVASGTKLGNNTMSLNENLVDMRYTFNDVTTNASTSSLVAEKPVFICFDLADMISSNFANTSCLAKLKSPYITQEMNDMSTLYVLVGYMHDSYRCSLIMDNLTYAYGPAGFNCFTTSDVSNRSVSALLADTVNGHTVEKDVPSNAVFTDHTYSGTGLISVNSSGVISTTAEANQNAFSNVKVGSTTVAADTKTDTLELVADKGIELTPDATNNKVTIKNNQQGIYTVIGTQTAATGTWTGALHGVSALYDGLTIMYYIPWGVPSSTNVTLNLTLDDGTTTGAVDCYYHTSRLTTHYTKGSNIVMTYWSAGSIKVDGTATTNNRWIANANYDSNSNDTAYYLRRYYAKIKAGANKIFPYTFIMQLPDGRWESIVTSSSTGTTKARNTHGFLLGQICWMYANATYNENAIVGDTNVWDYHTGANDHRYSFNTANNSTSGTTANKPIYLVGALGNDGLFYLDTTWWTQTLPTSEDGKLYIYLGDAYDYYRMDFVVNNTIYYYKQGALRQFTQHSATTNYAIGGKDPLCIPGTNITAEGTNTWPSGNYSHAEGNSTSTIGESSHAEGYLTYAVGTGSHAEGYATSAIANYSHTEGLNTYTNQTYTHAEGKETTAVGDASHAEGYQTSAAGEQAHAEGVMTSAQGNYSHTEGNKSIATHNQAHAEGRECTAGAVYSHAEGYGTKTSGSEAHAEGKATRATKEAAHAEGWQTTAEQAASHSEGLYTRAMGARNHAEGNYTTSLGQQSHAEGSYSYSVGSTSHAEGDHTTAIGVGSHSEGCYTCASVDYQHVSGKYNVADDNMAYIIGGGTSSARKNIFTVDWNGMVSANGGYFGVQCPDNTTAINLPIIDSTNSNLYIVLLKLKNDSNKVKSNFVIIDATDSSVNVASILHDLSLVTATKDSTSVTISASTGYTILSYSYLIA